jgi:four helix bundle protein
MQDFRDLKVWVRSHALLLDVYRVSAAFPREELYGLTAQLRRAALSVPTNIVEGSKRIGRRDYLRFLNVAQASLVETECLLMVARDLGYLKLAVAEPLLALANEVGRMLGGLRAAVLERLRLRRAPVLRGTAGDAGADPVRALSSDSQLPTHNSPEVP